MALQNLAENFSDIEETFTKILSTLTVYLGFGKPSQIFWNVQERK